MHAIDLKNFNIRTDLIVEEKIHKKCKTTKSIEDKIIIEKTTSYENNNLYTTITFEDITDKDNYKKVEKILIQELKPYIIKLNLKKEDPILIVGLGNSNSTPDSLGPKTINQILVTRYLYTLGVVDEGYQNVSAITPETTATTGIETSEVIESISKKIGAKLIIIIDALASLSVQRLNKTIQITNTGIHPGSGIGNNRKEISSNNLNIPVIAIGVPTVVDATTIVCDTFKYMDKQFTHKLNNYKNKKYKLISPKQDDYRKEKGNLTMAQKKEILGELGTLNDKDFKNLIYEVLTPINYNLMVTPVEIDFLIEKLSLLIGNSINKILHDTFNSTNK